MDSSEHSLGSLLQGTDNSLSWRFTIQGYFKKTPCRRRMISQEGDPFVDFRERLGPLHIALKGKSLWGLLDATERTPEKGISLTVFC